VIAVAERVFPLHTGVATVTAIDSPTPAMRRFTLHAPEFADPGIEQPGEIMTLGWPADGEPLVLPGVGWRFSPGVPEQHWRNFTVRDYAPQRATIDVDFFVHGDVGRASAWAERACIGDEVGFAGPRTHWQADTQATWSLLVADETGIPAQMAILETLPAGHRAIAIAEVADDAERQAVTSAAEVEMHWVSRAGRPPGTTGVLIETLRALSLPRTRGQVWGGGEALAMRDVRRHLQRNHPAAAASMRVLGYWKHRATPEAALRD
jgi:NADPH-dependent ferric siderophore reductase